MQGELSILVNCSSREVTVMGSATYALFCENVHEEGYLIRQHTL